MISTDLWLTTVDLLLRACGDAPIMKKKNWRVESDKTIGWISEFIKRYIKLEANETLVGVSSYLVVDSKTNLTFGQ